MLRCVLPDAALYIVYYNPFNVFYFIVHYCLLFTVLFVCCVGRVWGEGGGSCCCWGLLAISTRTHFAPKPKLSVGRPVTSAGAVGTQEGSNAHTGQHALWGAGTGKAGPGLMPLWPQQQESLQLSLGGGGGPEAAAEVAAGAGHVPAGQGGRGCQPPHRQVLCIYCPLLVGKPICIYCS